MEENKEFMSPLEQMNQLLSDKKTLIAAEMEKLTTAKQELLAFQKELQLKVVEIKAEQKEIKKEREELAKEWEKLREAQKNMESSMAQVLAEKVKLEQESMDDFKRILQDFAGDSDIQTGEGEFNLDELRKSIGLDTVPGPQEADENKIPELFVQLEKEISKSYSKWSKLELVPERYCLQFGDKEIRFFDSNDENQVPYVQIIVFARKAKMDNRLLGNLAGAARVVPEWGIGTEGSTIVCTMQFTRETKITAVLKKCNDFMKNYLS